MISDPGRMPGILSKLGRMCITFHIEACPEPAALLKEIRGSASAGLVLNPDTPLSAVDVALDLCDLVLVMSVQAGFGGQKFNPIALEKLRHLRSEAPPRPCLRSTAELMHPPSMPAPPQAPSYLWLGRPYSANPTMAKP